MSRPVSAAEESRISALDGCLDTQEPVSTLADELFAVVDAVEGQPMLRRSLTDPGVPEEARKALAHRLFENKVSVSALYVTEEAAALRWGGGRSLAAALERQGVRAELRAAMKEGRLDEVEDELFRFARMVEGNPGLGRGLSDRQARPQARRDMVTRLLDGRAHEATVVLARRAADLRERTYANTIEGYLSMAAQLRNRGQALVRVARELTEEQRSRLQEAINRQVGRDVELRVVVEPQLLGGVRVELGDEVIEGTVAGRLDAARRKFQ